MQFKLFFAFILVVKFGLIDSKALQLGPNPFVISGHPTDDPSEFPFLGRIFLKNIYRCGAVLTANSSTQLISAAHCLINLNGPNEGTLLNLNKLKVVAGCLDPNPFENVSCQIRDVHRVIVHPDFDRKTKANDIAKLFISEPFDLDIVYHSHTLHTNVLIPSNTDFDKDNCTAIGWGCTIPHGPGYPCVNDELNSLEMQLVPPSQCLELGIQPEFEGQLCAQGNKPQSGVYRGDSGGPLFCAPRLQKEDNIAYLVGIVSFGNESAPGPTVFTSVNYYKEFLKAEYDEAVTSNDGVIIIVIVCLVSTIVFLSVLLFKEIFLALIRGYRQHVQ